MTLVLGRCTPTSRAGGRINTAVRTAAVRHIVDERKRSEVRATAMMRANYVATILVVAALLQAVLVSAGPPDWIPPEMLDMIADDKARCMGEHGTTEALIEKANAGEIANDRSITCYMFCLLEAFSLVDEEGTFDTDMLLGVLPDSLQAKAGDIMAACGSQGGGDPCEKLYNIAVCVQSKAPEVWFVV